MPLRRRLLGAALFVVPALGQDGGGDPLPQVHHRAGATQWSLPVTNGGACNKATNSSARTGLL